MGSGRKGKELCRRGPEEGTARGRGNKRIGKDGWELREGREKGNGKGRED